MARNTEQMEAWDGQFGKEYTDRNAPSLEELQSLYRRNYGLTRTELNRRFLERLDPSARILEVGSNVGNQLLCLQQMGFTDLWGIELQSYAVELSKSRTKDINIIKASAFDIPYKDGYFDLVFTSGLLIHIAPSDVGLCMSEIYRCTREYIWGFEYYADNVTEVVYRGQKRLLWKANFPRLYLDRFDDLELVKEEHIKYLDSVNVDVMFLLRKRHEQ